MYNTDPHSQDSHSEWYYKEDNEFNKVVKSDMSFLSKGSNE